MRNRCHVTGRREACLTGRGTCGLCFTRRTRDVRPLTSRMWGRLLRDGPPPEPGDLTGTVLAVYERMRRVTVGGSAGPFPEERS